MAVTQDPEAWARLGAEIREAREALGYSRKRLSDIAGVSEKSIQVAEEGRTPRARWPQSLTLIEEAIGWMRGSMLEVLAGGKPRLSAFNQVAMFPGSESFQDLDQEIDSEVTEPQEEMPDNHSRSVALSHLPKSLRGSLDGVLSFGQRARTYGADPELVEEYEAAVEALIIDMTSRPLEWSPSSRDPGRLARWRTALRMDPMLRRIRDDRLRESRRLREAGAQSMFRLDRHAATAVPDSVVGGTTSAAILQELRKLADEVSRLSKKVDDQGDVSPSE
ncbi:hypothetical protein ABT167_27550 [Streptomyces sp. NPDC001792]|uniref:helix-turn-helix domain-containing protein n=1 Tax=Streptomyces sp. NPDC001792 TaxID=3154524 RepID=UPI00331FF1A6